MSLLDLPLSTRSIDYSFPLSISVFIISLRAIAEQEKLDRIFDTLELSTIMQAPLIVLDDYSHGSNIFTTDVDVIPSTGLAVVCWFTKGKEFKGGKYW